SRGADLDSAARKPQRIRLRVRRRERASGRRATRSRRTRGVVARRLDRARGERQIRARAGGGRQAAQRTGREVRPLRDEYARTDRAGYPGFPDRKFLIYESR